jgi:hypothetical protein
MRQGGGAAKLAGLQTRGKGGPRRGTPRRAAVAYKGRATWGGKGGSDRRCCIEGKRRGRVQHGMQEGGGPAGDRGPDAAEVGAG